MLTSRAVSILKHWGKLTDTKVSYTTRDGVRVIHIGDREHYEFAEALRHLQELAKSIVSTEEKENNHLNVI